MEDIEPIEKLRHLGLGPNEREGLRWAESVESLVQLEIATSPGIVAVVEPDHSGSCAEYNVVVSDGPGPPKFNQRSTNLPQILLVAAKSCHAQRTSVAVGQSPDEAPTMGLLNKWTKAAELLAALDAISRGGCNVLLKIDGEREKDIYTVVISTEVLEPCFHQDSADLLGLLCDAIEFFVERSTRRGSQGWRSC